MTNGAKRPGTWAKGQSGNPAGRPALPAEFREQIRSHTAAAIAVLVRALDDEDARVRVRPALGCALSSSERRVLVPLDRVGAHKSDMKLLHRCR